jgi:hypothetical protein
MKKLLILCLVVLSACHSKPNLPFTILKSVKADGGAIMDVQLKSRLSKQDMISIAATIKSDSSQYTNLQLDYLLPGNSYKNTGGIAIYATAAYHESAKVTAADTVKDADNHLLSFEFNGFTTEQAKHLLAFNPPDTAGKVMLGKFIDDNTHTVSLVFRDKLDGNEIHILEMDADGKVVSATVPMEVPDNGLLKLVVSKQGDYMIIKDSLLTMYSGTEPDKPFRSIKKGL